MIRNCIINISANIVINIVDYETQPSNPPLGYSNEFIAVASNIGQIGWTWDGTQLNPPPVNKDESIAIYKINAQNALIRTDSVALRCLKYGVTFTQDWVDYTKALHAIISDQNIDPTQPFPLQPPFPAGS